MKHYFYALLLVIIISTSISTHAQSKKFGLGVIFGEPTGLSAKLWLSNTNALAFGLGWSVQGYVSMVSIPIMIELPGHIFTLIISGIHLML